MKGLILSGGRGTRLRPFTYACAKQLIPVANKPILFYGIEALRKAGITEIGIVTGNNREEIVAAVGEGERWGVRITTIPQAEPRGLAHAVQVARPFLGEDGFLMYLGDNLIGDDLSGMVERFKAKNADAMVMLAEVREPERFGIAEMDGERVVRVAEKPRQPRSNLALVGVYLFNPLIHEAINEITPSWRNELEITDAIQVLVARGARVEAHWLTGWWKDTGRVDDLLEANRVMLDRRPKPVTLAGEVDANSQLVGDVELGPGSVVAGSIIRGPVAIGAGCRVVRSYIGPYTSLGAGSAVENTELEHSIVMEGCSLRSAGRIMDSVIGESTTVTGVKSRPQAHRLLLGHDSFLVIN